jgi:hypothetical protein
MGKLGRRAIRPKSVLFRVNKGIKNPEFDVSLPEWTGLQTLRA